MTNQNLADLISRYDYIKLQEGQFTSSLSLEEQILLSWNPTHPNRKMTIEQFAKKFEGDTLSIYYKNGEQVGFVRLGHNEVNTTAVLQTLQNITFDIDHPENGLLTFNLDEYRKTEK